MKSFQELAAGFKKNWKRFALRGVRYGNKYGKLDALYVLNDPWSMDSPDEQHRFAETNRLILEKFGRVGSILEVGCGEGHQSFRLSEVCEHLVGLDVSRRAVARARKRCPGNEFLAGDIFSPEADARAPFDLVVACEVLYYIGDVPATLRRMQTLGRNCLVSYFAGEMKNLDPLVLTLPGAASEELTSGQTTWRAVYWRGNRN